MDKPWVARDLPEWDPAQTEPSLDDVVSDGGAQRSIPLDLEMYWICVGLEDW